MPLLTAGEPRPKGAGMAALRELAGVHVLVVEDTDDSRELLRIALEYCGARVTTAASAEEAKRILESVRPHVLVSDIAMPDDGIELIREVMTVAQRKGLRIPAIAITAYRGRREELLAEGFAELVEKPIDPIALCGTIRRHAQLQT
jgi:CheY-like chemotaxis protein